MYTIVTSLGVRLRLSSSFAITLSTTDCGKGLNRYTTRGSSGNSKSSASSTRSSTREASIGSGPYRSMFRRAAWMQTGEMSTPTSRRNP